MIPVEIPTFHYLKKFVLHRYHSTTGRITVSTQKAFGIDLLKLLHKENYQFRKRTLPPFETTLTVEVNEYYTSKAGLDLTEDNFRLFNNRIKNDFEESLYDHIIMNLTRFPDIRIEDEILHFCNFYSITEDELKLDALIKDFYRWRKRRKYMLIR